MLGGLGVDRHSQLGLDRLELLLEKILALTLLDLVVELALDLLLDTQELLFLLDEYQHLLEAFPDVDRLQDSLLLGRGNVEDGGHEVGDLPGVVDVHHVEPHLLGKQRVVLRDLLHLGDQGTGQGVDLDGLQVAVVKVLDRGHQRGSGVQELGDSKAAQRGHENVDAAVRQVDLAHDLGGGAHTMEFCDSVAVSGGSGVDSESASSRTSTRPMQPSPSRAWRTTSTPFPSGIIIGVKTPGNTGVFGSGRIVSLGGRTVSAGMICRCSMRFESIGGAGPSQACAAHVAPPTVAGWCRLLPAEDGLRARASGSPAPADLLRVDGRHATATGAPARGASPSYRLASPCARPLIPMRGNG